MELVLAKSQDAIVLTSISKRAFNSDIGVGGTQAGGPPGYQSHKFYMKNIQSQKKRYISRPERMSLSTGPKFHRLVKRVIVAIFTEFMLSLCGCSFLLSEIMESNNIETLKGWSFNL